MATAPTIFTSTNPFPPRLHAEQKSVRLQHGRRRPSRSSSRRTKFPTIMARQQQEEKEQEEEQQSAAPTRAGQEQIEVGRRGGAEGVTVLREEPRQPTARSKNMGREYGSQWLSSATRHVRIYAAYIDPSSRVFDQTQTDKLTLLLDPTNEFIWTPETCRKVYVYFQELVDHYEGADLTEYTLRLIGSDLEHYIRKLLYDGEIKYNMDARVLNFSMGKPRIVFRSEDDDQRQLEDADHA